MRVKKIVLNTKQKLCTSISARISNMFFLELCWIAPIEWRRADIVCISIVEKGEVNICSAMRNTSYKASFSFCTTTVAGFLIYNTCVKECWYWEPSAKVMSSAPSWKFKIEIHTASALSYACTMLLYTEDLLYQKMDESLVSWDNTCSIQSSSLHSQSMNRVISYTPLYRPLSTKRNITNKTLFCHRIPALTQ